MFTLKRYETMGTMGRMEKSKSHMNFSCVIIAFLLITGPNLYK